MQTDYEPNRRSNSRVLPPIAALFSLLPNPWVISSVCFLSWSYLKLKAKTTNQRNAYTTYQVFLILAQAHAILIDSVHTLRGKFINVLGFFFFKAQVVADGDLHIYIHLIVIDPVRVFPEMGEPFFSSL